jgi:hypothetical protein
MEARASMAIAFSNVQGAYVPTRELRRTGRRGTPVLCIDLIEFHYLFQFLILIASIVWAACSADLTRVLRRP